ncbi:hypothetical protein TgHK011_002218 [Trichoderma gracile]|nr:hypothetical protein TgHK011_002218 [Trichoderma gracile]
MYPRQQRFSWRRKGPTTRNSRLSSRRAAPLPTATVAAPEAEAAATPKPAVEEVTRWQTLRCIIKRRRLYIGNFSARRQGFRVGCARCDDELLVALAEPPSDPQLLERQTALMLACGHIFWYGRVLYRVMDDMEKNDVVEMEADDVLSRYQCGGCVGAEERLSCTS